MTSPPGQDRKQLEVLCGAAVSLGSIGIFVGFFRPDFLIAGAVLFSGGVIGMAILERARRE